MGTASDETGVANVSVNGVNASSNDGFATWSAIVELVEGPNTLTVATLDTLGFSDPMAAQQTVTLTSAPPLATITFPPPNSLSDADSLTVTGTAMDARSGVKSVEVNGVEAVTSDGYATWRTVEPVPLTLGINTLTVMTVDEAGFTDPVAAMVDVNVAADVSGNPDTFGDGYAIALDGNRAYVVDFEADQLVEVNIDTGNKVIISDAANGSGPVLDGPDGIALINGGTAALVSNFVPDELLSVELVGGIRTIKSSLNANVGGGPTLFGPSGIVLVDDTRALVSNFAADEIIEVSLVNGERIILSADDGINGIGPAFLQPDGIAMDTANNRILVTDALVDAVFSVNLGTGDRDIISNIPEAGTCMSFYNPNPDLKLNPNPVGIMLDPSGDFVLVTDYDANLLLRVRLADGDCSIFSDANSNVGTGPAFIFPAGIALDAANNRAVVSGGNLVVVELGSGDRVIVGQ
jgi:sugar lactone lactonase YvrE